MSMHHKVGITCPKCQKAGVFTVWDSINTKLDPDMKDRVKSLELFATTAATAGRTSRSITASCITTWTIIHGLLRADG